MLLKFLESFEDYVFVVSFFEKNELGKIKYYKRKLSFVKSFVWERLGADDKKEINYSERFWDKNLISKFEEFKKFGTIKKFKSKIISYILNEILGFKIDIDFEKLNFDISTLSDLKNMNHEFFIALHDLLRKEGYYISYHLLFEKFHQIANFLINFKYGKGFFYEVYGFYNFIKKELKGRGVNFVESGSVLRFDRIIENICFIVRDPNFCPFKFLQSIEVSFEIHRMISIEKEKIFIFKTNLCKVPLMFVISEDYLPYYVYFLFNGRYFPDNFIKHTNDELESFLSKWRELNIYSLDSFFDYLGFHPIPPELVDYPNIFEIAKQDDFQDLVNFEDIKGDLHVHSNFSDGKNTLEEIVKCCKKKGYEYVGISDHVDYFLEKAEEYVNLRELDGLRIFWAVEENIDPNGDLFSDKNQQAMELVKKLDYLNLSIHSDFKLSEELNFRRLKNALEKQKGLILCHLTTRVLGIRDPINLSNEKIFEIFDYANSKGKFIEINSHLDRLDIDYQLIIDYRLLRNREVNIVINTDAHSLEQLDYMEWGVKWARKAFVKKNNVLNNKSFEQIIK